MRVSLLTKRLGDWRRGFGFPIRLKIVLLTAIALTMSLASYLYVGNSLIVADKASYIYDYCLGQIKAESLIFEGQIQKVVALGKLIDGAIKTSGDQQKSKELQKVFNGTSKSLGITKLVLMRSIGLTQFAFVNAVGADQESTRSLASEFGWTPTSLSSTAPTVRITATGKLAIVAKLGNAAKEGYWFMALVKPDDKNLEESVKDLDVRAFDSSRSTLILKTGTRGALSKESAEKLAKLAGTKFSLGVQDIALNEDDYIAAYQRIDSMGLFFVSLIPKSVAFAAAQQLVKRSLLIGVSILLLAIGLTLIFAKQLTSRLQQMWYATKKVSEGDFSFRVATKGSIRDEIADLAVSFNSMSDKIQELMAEVAEKVRIEKELEKKQAIQEILDNLDEGFMTFDAQGQILEGISKSAERFFGEQLLSQPITDVLNIPPEKAGDVKDWVQMLFSEPLPFSELKGLGPKSYDSENGRYIELDYRSVRDKENKVERIILVSTDKTNEKALQAKAEADAALVKMAISIMRDRAAFISFVCETRKNLATAQKELLKQPEKIDVDLLFRLMHSIKGAATGYYVLEVKKLAHSIEDEFAKIKESKGAPTENAIQTLRGQVDSLQRTFEDFLVKHERVIGRIEAAVEREKTIGIAKVKETLASLERALGPNSPIVRDFRESYLFDRLENCFARFDSVVRSVAEKQGKTVSFEVAKSGISVDSEAYEPLFGAMVHAFRNAVDHGLESGDERARLGKDPAGKIGVSFEIKGAAKKKLVWCITDDGRGIDPNMIRRVAIERKMMDSEQAKALSEHDALQLVFAAGFSSKHEVSEISGRGVGLDAIQHEATALKGKAWIESVPGKGTKLFVEVPFISSEAASAMPKKAS